MYRKLDETAITGLLEAGIKEFSEKGLDKANVNTIAKRAGISVGVIYKYYKDKDQLFLSCVDYSLKLLEQAMTDLTESGEDFKGALEILIEELVRGAAEHPSYYVMYNEITSGSCRKYAAKLAEEIETKTAEIYAALIEKAKQDGSIAVDGDPRLFAFLFDNMLMMLQFSFSCEYYKERMKIFCGEEVLDNPEKMKETFLNFMAGAFRIG